MGRRRPFIIAGSFFGTISMLITVRAGRARSRGLRFHRH
jgi:hypothetical protein